MSLRTHVEHLLACVCAVALVAASAGCLGKDFSVAESARDLRGLDATVESVRIRGIADSDIDELARFTRLRNLDFTGGWAAMPLRTTSAGFARLAALDLPHVTSIGLGNCPGLDDASLREVARLGGLESVRLNATTGFSRDGLEPLLRLPGLTSLDLRECSQVDDTWTELLSTATRLQQLGVAKTAMTDDGVARLRAALPDCHVDDDPRYVAAALDRAQYPGWRGPPERRGR